MERQNEVQQFVLSAIGQYYILKHEVFINDSSCPDYTDFEVVITNGVNRKRVSTVLRCHDYQGGIEILKGEDFFATDEKDFIMDLFLTFFLDEPPTP